MADICHISTTFNKGSGSARRTLMEARHQKSCGLRVVHIIGADNDLSEEDFNEFDYVIIDELKKNIHITNDIISLVKIRKHLAQIKPKIVNTHLAKAGVLHRLIGSSLSFKTIHTVHGPTFQNNVGGLANRIYKLLENLCSKNTDVFEFVGQEIRELYLDSDICTQEKSTVIHTAKPNLEKFRNIRLARSQKSGETRKGPLSIVQIGRLVPVKQQEVTLRMLAEVNKTGLDVMLFFVGTALTESEKWYEEYLRKMTKELNLESMVEFVGHVEDISDNLKYANLCVLTSKYEGLPNVVVESVLAGVPIVSYNVCGVKEVLGPALKNYIVESNTLPELVQKVIGVESMLDEVACEIFKRAEQIEGLYTEPTMNKKKYDLVCEILGRHEDTGTRL